MSGGNVEHLTMTDTVDGHCEINVSSISKQLFFQKITGFERKLPCMLIQASHAGAQEKDQVSHNKQNSAIDQYSHRFS